MEDDVQEDIERRVKELRGWVSKGTRPRRVAYLATALYDIVRRYPDHEFPEAWLVLQEVKDTYDPVRTAGAIFDAIPIRESERRQRKRLAFGGGWEPASIGVGDSGTD